MEGREESKDTHMWLVQTPVEGDKRRPIMLREAREKRTMRRRFHEIHHAWAGIP